MIQGRCPICSRRFQAPTLDDWPPFPFCSERCRLVDLGRWVDGKYAIPGATAPEIQDISSGDMEEPA
jgi:endogenous inhibitor of DNA gyrase (YacG/DUF329 family)